MLNNSLQDRKILDLVNLMRPVMKKLGRVYARYARKSEFREILVPYAPYPRRVIPNLPAGIKLTINNHINKKIK